MLRTAHSKKICHAARNERSECSRSTHSSPPHPTANSAPYTHNTVATATQALDKLEQKLDRRLRVAATHFANNTAQGFVQQSLPKMLLGGHWLTEKFQFLSTLAWQSGDDKGGILGELDLVVPLYGMRDAGRVDQYGFFLQPGLVSWEADNGYRRLDVNVGLVYRQRIREHTAVGASVFYDHNIDSDLKRIGAGADVVSPYTYLSLNYYEPLDGWRTGERLGYEERALRGVDVNIEQALWDSHWVLEASGGYWKGYDSDNRHGEWRLAGSVGIHFYPLDYLSVYADYAYHHQDVDTDHFAAGIEFSYPGKHRGISENEIDLWRLVKREKRILYAERKKTPTLTLTTNPADVTAGSTISLLVTSDVAVPDILTLSLTISGQVAASDFTNGLMQSVDANFNGGTAATVTIATVKDADAVETYTITLGSGSGYTVGSDSTAAGRITMALPILTLATDPSAVNPGSNISLVITSDDAVAGMLTLPLTISDRGSSGLVAGYFSGGLTQSVSANFNGNTTATVTISTVRLGGSARAYTITLGSGTGYTVGNDSTANGMISALIPILTLPTNPRAVMAGSDISLVVNSNIAVAGTLTLTLTISDFASSSITAADFTNGLTQSVRADFSGGITATVMIGTVKDNDADEGYTITLGSSNSYTVGSDNTATGLLEEAIPTLTLTTNPAPVVAGNDISLMITSDIPVAGSLRVAFELSDRGSNNIDIGDFSIPLTRFSLVTRVFIGAGDADFNGGNTATMTIGTVRDSDTTAEDYGIKLARNRGIYTIGNPDAVVGTINAP